MKRSLHRTGVIGRAVIALSLGCCCASQAGMQVQPMPSEPSPKAAPAAASAAPNPRLTAIPPPATKSRPPESIAWSPCIRLINAAALGAASQIGWRQALAEQCTS